MCNALANPETAAVGFVRIDKEWVEGRLMNPKTESEQISNRIRTNEPKPAEQNLNRIRRTELNPSEQNSKNRTEAHRTESEQNPNTQKNDQRVG